MSNPVWKKIEQERIQRERATAQDYAYSLIDDADLKYYATTVVKLQESPCC